MLKITSLCLFSFSLYTEFFIMHNNTISHILYKPSKGSDGGNVLILPQDNTNAIFSSRSKVLGTNNRYANQNAKMGTPSMLFQVSMNIDYKFDGIHPEIEPRCPHYHTVAVTFGLFKLRGVYTSVYKVVLELFLKDWKQSYVVEKQWKASKILRILLHLVCFYKRLGLNFPLFICMKGNKPGP